MKDINDHIDSPLILKVSFNNYLRHYESLAKSQDVHLVNKANRVLKAGNSVPQLRDGFSDPQLLKTYQKEINIILEDAFSEILTKNEIKTASVPFHDLIFNSSERFKSIINNAGDDYHLKISNLPDEDKYRIACTIILYFCYGYDINFKRPFFYEIPDAKGILRTYKILYNAEFTEVIATESAPKITQDDVDLLLDYFDDIELWREKFPPQSYIFKGFTINNIFDVTDDRSISNIKSTLLELGKRESDNFIEDFQTTFESLFDIKDLKVGFVIYNKAEQAFERVLGKGIESYLLFNSNSEDCKTALCEASYKALINENSFFSISDVDKYYKLSNGIAQYKTLHEQGIKSAILAPIAINGELLGVLELVSDKAKELNSINANKLVDVMPYIVSSVLRSKEEEENLIEAIIQQECTSIHPSVHWKFERAARNFLRQNKTNNTDVVFEEIAFKNVYPLFGQIDVKGSSDARNMATQKDLILQLNLVKKIIVLLLEVENMPIYEQLNFQVENFIVELETNFKVDSEQQIVNFFKNDINPLFEFHFTKTEVIKDAIDNYFSKVDSDLKLIYFYRKNYDDTVALINKNMSYILDTKQVEVQKMYPHYFERYKTDGVDHNMYIGESITKKDSFNIIYLYNLRLWQLQVMCEMENEYYHNQHQYPISLDVASMLLAFNQPLSIRFRMDEKQFDVDGTYNARYEVVKKRIDKAYIKGTEQRITVKGKITIIYSQKEDEEEYLKYIKFLQSKRMLGDVIETLEIQDLQGVTGLKALRVPILYHKDADYTEFYTYDDLMKELNP